MKHIYIALITFLVFSFGASAQVLLHHENFNETSTGTVAGIYVEPASTWEIASAVQSTVAQSSKGNYVKTVNSASGAKSLSIRVSTLSYSNATITWNQFRNPFKNNFPLNAPVELQYSVNGGATRTTFYTSTNNINGSWNKVNSGAPIALPAAAMGLPEVRIYWKITISNSNTNSEAAYYAIDDVTITATPETGISTFDWTNRPADENPFAVSGTNSTTPYTVDGVTMRWSSALSTGVTYEVAKVDDKTYKANTKSLTLVQTGASATAGSVVQLDLNKPVEDLTFTIFDIDIAADQFIDKITVTGYNNGTQVPLVKNKVKTTSYNKFASAALSGVIASDNASNEGDVTITFAQAVTRVVIQYHNSSAIRNGNGRQGIAIHNLTWKKEQQIAPLPVELAYFKAAKQNNAAILSWSTASEKDNEKFEIERSLDGKRFSKIGEVAGNGTSSRKLSYSFSDNRPATGINYYRLRQVDFDGKVSFSKMVEVSFTAAKTDVPLAQVFPTMAVEKVTIALAQVDAKTAVQILDAAGKTITHFTQVTGNELVVPVQNLKSGMYFVNVSNGEARETYRFLKQ
ncbi:T9SS type A sorting domain-containing protein [Pontibacter sp. KCTC 32443]|uniref:T9SS type A sorting domain-containing protein n=1 Tax=Pontibacter TaxID=323449 RepID=UPI00164DE992|nr:MULTISPECIES: T9SS type A sorting domain-containing protein [Pontibacter]MBC5775712.1 T9SS type A sorting domain-containing protein [Pontibacter sp. KCTC 32443]